MSDTTTHLLASLDTMTSEGRNAHTLELDNMSTLDLLTTMNNEDAKVAAAVNAAIPAIANVVDKAVAGMRQGGRLFYLGAGTSGRLGILDAAECRPTFSVPDGVVVGIIAGGDTAIQHAVEGAEDNKTAGAQDLAAYNIDSRDTVIGLSASGRTPYVIGALEYAQEYGVFTAAVACNSGSDLIAMADVGICANVGAECLTGSTRLKSGTAQKLILNMVSTAVMVKLGKVYQNLMVDVNASNEKLIARAIRIVMQATDCEQAQASQALEAAQYQAKTAILMILANVDAPTATTMLNQNQGYLRRALV